MHSNQHGTPSGQPVGAGTFRSIPIPIPVPNLPAYRPPAPFSALPRPTACLPAAATKFTDPESHTYSPVPRDRVVQLGRAPAAGRCYSAKRVLPNTYIHRVRRLPPFCTPNATTPGLRNRSPGGMAIPPCAYIHTYLHTCMCPPRLDTQIDRGYTYTPATVLQ